MERKEEKKWWLNESLRKKLVPCLNISLDGVSLFSFGLLCGLSMTAVLVVMPTDLSDFFFIASKNWLWIRNACCGCISSAENRRWQHIKMNWSDNYRQIVITIILFTLKLFGHCCVLFIWKWTIFYLMNFPISNFFPSSPLHSIYKTVLESKKLFILLRNLIILVLGINGLFTPPGCTTDT